MRYLLAVILISLSGCASMQAKDFIKNEPRFIPEEYFLGKTRGDGVFYGPTGKVAARFGVDLEGSWDGSTLTLKEQLVYDWGETVKRTFLIRKLDDHRYEVTADDLVEPGLIESYGNALRWRYRLRQKVGDRVLTLRFDDWMFLERDGVVLNRAEARWTLFHAGEVFMAVRKVP